ncbi:MULTISPECIES: hypothetical protein [Pseudomonas]|jgi:hypothetical protein|uniref:hypothetical protein n=1 Tax=Pseudomonas TaxID=286 RepID=UPI0002E14B24|nr:MULTISPECIES: hypothetical protein [Pseudomonas]MDR7282860.1 hypothetical protein [Pseudomonas corrugata]
MNAPNHELLDRVLTAHGGVERWNSFSKVDTTLVTGGALWAMKGLISRRPAHLTESP